MRRQARAGEQAPASKRRQASAAKEDQATDRVYRIGQTKKVHIYYPMATLPSGQKSFDDIINERIEMKKSLSDDIMFPSEKITVTNREVIEALT